MLSSGLCAERIEGQDGARSKLEVRALKCLGIVGSGPAGDQLVSQPAMDGGGQSSLPPSAPLRDR